MVKAGDVVKVKVLEVDIPRKRISLTLRLDDDVAAGADQAGGRPRAEGRPAPDPGRAGRGPGPRPGPAARRGGRPGGGNRGGGRDAAPDGALADALRRAGLVPKPPRDR